MVSWTKNRNGRQVPSWCTGYAVLPHQFFLSGWMQQNPVAGDQVFVVRYISKEWYFLCRRLATVVDVWSCRQLSVTWVTVFTAYTSVIRPLSCRLYMDGTVFFPVFCMCGAITCLMQVTEKISDWSGYPEQQVRFVFVLYFRNSLRFVHNILCFRSGIKFRDFFRQAFSTCKYSGFSCQDWNSWSGSIPFLPIQMCLSVHCISYARVFQLPIYDGRPLSRMSWIIFFGICGIKRFLSGNLSCLSFYTVLSSLSPLFYGQSHVSPRHFALSLLVDNGADHLKPDNIFCASR